MEGQEAKKNSPGAELLPRQCRFRDRKEGNGNSIAARGFSGMMLQSCSVVEGLTILFDVVVVVSIGHCSQPNVNIIKLTENQQKPYD